MDITSAQYRTDFDGNNVCICATINGVEIFVPLDSNNNEYAEIMRQQSEGLLTIADAD